MSLLQSIKLKELQDLASAYGLNRHKQLAIGFVLLNLLITVPLVAILNIWVDEAYSLNTTEHGLMTAIDKAFSIEIQPPFYFALLGLWRSLNDSVFFARLFSVICVALIIYTVSLVSQRYIRTIHPGWSTAAVAFHPYLIWSAAEIRPYALCVLLSALLLLFFFDGYLAQRPHAHARWFYGITAIIALYTNYLLAVILLAHLGFLAALRYWRFFSLHLMTLIVVGAGCLPLLPMLFLQSSSTDAALGYLSSSFLQAMKATLGRSLIYTVTTCDSSWPTVFRFLCYKAVAITMITTLVMLLWVVVRNRRRVKTYHVALWSTVLAALLAITVLLDATDLAIRANRYVFPIFIPALLSLFAAFSLIQSARVRQRSLVLWFSVILIPFYFTSLVLTYAPLAKPGDWQRVASYIMANEHPNQPIVIFYAEAVLPFQRYYSGANMIIPLPRKVGIEVYNFQEGILKDETEIVAALNQLPDHYQSLWLINHPNEFIDRPNEDNCKILQLDFNCQLLEEFVQHHYATKQRKDFYDSTVRLLYPDQDSEN